MFPTDALNVRTDATGNGTTTLIASLSSDSTVLYESFNTDSTNSNAILTISCYPTILLKVNSFSQVPEIELFKEAKCSAGSSLAFNVSGVNGSPTVTVSLVYVPRYRNVTPDPYPYAQNPNTNSVALASSSLATLPTSTDSYTAVALFIVVATVLVLDLLRRLFAPHLK